MATKHNAPAQGGHYRLWTPSEDAKLAELYHDAPQAAIFAALPGRKWDAVMNRANRLGLHRQARGAWPAAHLAILREHYVTTGPTRLMKLLPYSRVAIAGMGKRLGLKTDLFARPAMCRAPKAERAPRVAKAKAEPKARVAKPKAIKQQLGRRVLTPTPNLNAQKALVAKKKEVRVSISTEEIRRLPANDPQRRIYAIGGRAAVEAYRLQQAA